MDKLAIGLFADVLYIKELINFEEYEAIMEIETAEDVQTFVDKLLGGEFRGYKKGETYALYRK